MISSNRNRCRFAILALAGAAFLVPGVGKTDEDVLDLPGISQQSYGRPTIIATPPPVEATVSFSGDFVSSKNIDDPVGVFEIERKSGDDEVSVRIEDPVEESMIEGGEEEYLATRWNLRALPPRGSGSGAPLRKLVLVPKSAVPPPTYLEEISMSEIEVENPGLEDLVAGVEDLGVDLPAGARRALGWFLGRPTTPEMLERISVTIRNALDDPSRPIEDIEIVRQNDHRGSLRVVVSWRERLAKAEVETKSIPLPGEISRQASAH